VSHDVKEILFDEVQKVTLKTARTKGATHWDMKQLKMKSM